MKLIDVTLLIGHLLFICHQMPLFSTKLEKKLNIQKRQENIVVGNFVMVENLRVFERATINVGIGRRTPQSGESDAVPLADANILTNYLIQKSFVTTIRALARVTELVEKLKQAGATAAIDTINENNIEYIKDVFAYKRLNQAGEVMETNADAVMELFNNVYALISESPQKPTEQITEALKSHQQDYIQIIEEMVIDRAADIQALGQGTFVKEAEEHLNELDRDNFKQLVSNYVVSMNASETRAQLKEVTDKEKHKMLDSLVSAIDTSVVQYKQKGAELLVRPEDERGKMTTLIDKFFRKGGMIVQGAPETEIFLIKIRRYIHRLQQLVILNGTLDKINSYHQAISAMELRVEEIFRASRAASTKQKGELIAERAKAENSSSDAYLRVASIFSETRARVLMGDSAMDEKNAAMMGSTSLIASQSRDYFDNRTKVINEMIVILNRLSAKLRSNHPIITAEAGQKNGPKTLEMLEDTVQTMAQIRSALQSETGKSLVRY